MDGGIISDILSYAHKKTPIDKRAGLPVCMWA